MLLIVVLRMSAKERLLLCAFISESIMVTQKRKADEASDFMLHET